MGREARRVESGDLMDRREYGRERGRMRKEGVELRRRRMASVGPWATLYFESFDTMFRQVHEMLHVESGGGEWSEEAIAGELEAYNGLIPQGNELVATLMFEIGDEGLRGRILGSLGGVEERVYLDIGGERAWSRPEMDVERSQGGGRTSSVHFLHFELSGGMKGALLRGDLVMAGVAMKGYEHETTLSEEVCAELAKDVEV